MGLAKWARCQRDWARFVEDSTIRACQGDGASVDCGKLKIMSFEIPKYRRGAVEACYEKRAMATECEPCLVCQVVVATTQLDCHAGSVCSTGRERVKSYSAVQNHCCRIIHARLLTLIANDYFTFDKAKTHMLFRSWCDVMESTVSEVNNNLLLLHYEYS